MEVDMILFYIYVQPIDIDICLVLDSISDMLQMPLNTLTTFFFNITH